MPNCVTYVPGIKWYLCVGKLTKVCTGDILYRLYRCAGRRAHGLQFRYKRIGGGFNPPHILVKES